MSGNMWQRNVFTNKRFSVIWNIESSAEISRWNICNWSGISNEDCSFTWSLTSCRQQEDLLLQSGWIIFQVILFNSFLFQNCSFSNVSLNSEFVQSLKLDIAILREWVSKIPRFIELSQHFRVLNNFWKLNIWSA